MKRMYKVLLAATILIFSDYVWAQENVNTWAIIGLGTDSCGSFSNAFDESRDPNVGIRWMGRQYYSQNGAYVQWILGYVTAYNTTSKKPGKSQISIDIQGVTRWIENYCKKNPTKMLVKAAGQFVITH